MSLDPEIDAMAKLSDALENLDQDAQKRVLKWASDKFSIPANLPSNAGGIKTITDVDENELTEDVIFEDFSDLYHLTSPKTDAERALIGAYWFQVVNKRPDVTALQVNNSLKNLGHGISNITRAFNNLKSMKPALIMQIKKSGSTKQARKKYKVTKSGITKVETMLDGS